MIIVRIYFGLGNQLFQYAYARALQEKGYNVYIDTKKKYEDAFPKYYNNDERENKLKYFNIKVSEATSKDMEKYGFLWQKNVKEKIQYYLAKQRVWLNRLWFEESEEELNEKELLFGNYYLSGFFQNEKFFKHIRKILLKEIRPKQKIKISRELKDLLSDKEIVSVHIRRGDYVKIGNELSLKYYQKAFETIEKDYAHPKYLFFSDDIEWVKEQFKEMKDIYFISDYGQFEDYEELMIMSSCRSNIIANSTFSWWGAWLNRNPQKLVIAPKKWISTQKNIIPDDWITI